MPSSRKRLVQVRIVVVVDAAVHAPVPRVVRHGSCLRPCGPRAVVCHRALRLQLPKLLELLELGPVCARSQETGGGAGGGQRSQHSRLACHTSNDRDAPVPGPLPVSRVSTLFRHAVAVLCVWALRRCFVGMKEKNQEMKGAPRRMLVRRHGLVAVLVPNPLRRLQRRGGRLLLHVPASTALHERGGGARQ